MGEHSLFIIVSYAAAHLLPALVLIASVLRRRALIQQEKQNAAAP